MNITPTTRINTIKLDVENAVIKIDPEYYAGSLNVTGK